MEDRVMPIYKQYHTPSGIINQELTVQEVLEHFELPIYPFYATITAMNVGAKKPLEVTRNWKGYTFTFNCYVTQDLRDQYVAGNVTIGDIVVVVFVDGDYQQALATQKIFKTW
jgi:hypothetical protein